MTDERVDATIRRAIGGDEATVASVVGDVMNTGDARLVALAALLASRSDWLLRAHGLAATARDRQIVAISASHLAGEHDLVQMLARDHLVDHPDSLIVAWIASGPGRHV